MPRGEDGKFVTAEGETFGTYVDEKGYPRISAGKYRGVRVHTLVAQAMLGRELYKHEDVHHKDGDKLNPHWTNLEVVDHRTHGFVSSKQAQAAKRQGQRQEEYEWQLIEQLHPGTEEIQNAVQAGEDRVPF
jgi:hypothetical protein